jgi:hypothetical protein
VINVVNLKIKRIKHLKVMTKPVKRKKLACKKQQVKRGVYVLKLNNDKYYVGKSNNISERIRKHSCEWVKKWGIIGIVKPLTKRLHDFESWERNETLERILTHGLKNVRGWRYCTMNIEPSDQLNIFHEICEKKDLCRKCGSANHMISKCDNEICDWIDLLK